jgi:predicted nucleic acid-binding protein
MSFVLDASATAAWIHVDEVTPALDQVFMELTASAAWVPELWRLEVANLLVMNVRKRRYDAASRDRYLQILDELPIQIDSHTGQNAWTRTLQLAEQHRLTVYDAAYLELAIRLSLPLITLDAELRDAAQRLDVPLRGR